MDNVEDNKNEQVASSEETTDELLAVETRPIFNSLIDNEENSRYLRDMMK